jgi:RecG-like helicase
MPVQETIKEIHYPTTKEANKRAIERVFFDRLLRVQLHSLISKNTYQA